MQQYIICFLYHIIFNFKILLLYLFKNVYSYILAIFLSYQNNKSFLDDIKLNPEFIANNKLPYHIAFLIIDEEPSYVDLSKLVIWSICFQIYKITFFDPKGSIKNNIDILKNEVKSCINAFHKCNYFSYDVYYKILNDNSYKITHKNGYSNKVIIYIADSWDGYKVLNKLCIKYCFQKSDHTKNGICQSKDKVLMDSQTFSTAMNSIYPEPNMALRFGSISTLANFMPWHLRFTEIISRHSHKNMTFRDFHHCLCQYSKCQQNFGT
ncbi:dehydrodolichyl diphosphate synthase complex subunit nus1-like isoform X2 [Gordionus sp. m RMFG-2023]|uniref:dehydrodolichyl diphosphate synthase complex subunit nus1-like isoform X2 n=1 Tax=Gordionus sp. m RMFG-2023 TaxID=3053472 RepID=UPI0031FBEF95